MSSMASVASEASEDLASVDLNVLLPDIASTLENIQSEDCFQQMLDADRMIDVLSYVMDELELKLEAQAVSEGEPLSIYARMQYRVITRIIAGLEELVKTLEGVQADARNQHNLRARALRQTDNCITDLPDELLLSIFQNFRPPLDFSTMSPDKGNGGGDLETIQNLRLTCLRFRQNSSHLLIRRLHVAPDMKSLELLERVSSHPEISRGERILSIDLRYYMTPSVEDPNLFSAVSFEVLKNGMESLESSIESLTRGRERDGDDQGQERTSHPLPKGMSIESAQNVVLRLKHILEIWEPFRHYPITGRDRGPTEDPHQVDTAILALRKGYERYRELYHEQHRLVEDGSFARAVAATAAACNSKVWLSMSAHITNDWRITELGELAKFEFDLSADPNRFDDAVSFLARSHPSWHQGYDRSWELSQSLLCEVPLAIHATGTKLAGLEISLPHPAQKLELDLSMSDEQLSCFAEVTKDLQAFSFATKPVDDDLAESLGVSRDFYNYLGAAMGRQIVPNLYLNLVTTTETPSRTEIPDGIRFPIEPFLRCSNWSTLKSALLANFDVRLEDLRKLIDMLEPGTRLRLGLIHLISGTWAEALDCLRSKVSQDSWLSGPLGAECNHMTGKEYAEIFTAGGRKAGGGRSKATQYIRSVEGVKNPLLTWEDGAAESNVEL